MEFYYQFVESNILSWDSLDCLNVLMWFFEPQLKYV